MKISVENTSKSSKQVKSNDLNAKKILIADKLINFYVPILNEESERKSRQFKKTKQDFKKIALDIKSTKGSIKKLESNIVYEQLVRRVLVETQRLMVSELLYGSIKELVVNTLTRLNNKETISIEELDKIVNTLNKSSKNAKKVIG